MRLYNFPPEVEELMGMLVEDPENEAINDTLQMLISEDIDTMCRVMREFSAEAEALDQEAAFFAKKALSRKSAVKRIRGQILGVMLATNQRKIKTAENTCSVSTRNKFILDVDPNDLPAEYKRVTVEARMKDIEAAMKVEDRGWGHYEQTESLTVR